MGDPISLTWCKQLALPSCVRAQFCTVALPVGIRSAVSLPSRYHPLRQVAMLTRLQFALCTPTSCHFLDRYTRLNGCTEQHRFMMQYLLDPRFRAAALVLRSGVPFGGKSSCGASSGSLRALQLE